MWPWALCKNTVLTPRRGGKVYVCFMVLDLKSRLEWLVLLPDVLGHEIPPDKSKR
jgi:hypothetical protein